MKMIALSFPVFSPYTKMAFKEIALEERKTERLITNRKIQFSFIKAYLVENKLERVWRKKIKYEILNDIVAQNSLDSIKESFATLDIKKTNYRK
jgi:carboxyl-terminal processing protease